MHHRPKEKAYNVPKPQLTKLAVSYAVDLVSDPGTKEHVFQFEQGGESGRFNKGMTAAEVVIELRRLATAIESRSNAPS